MHYRSALLFSINLENVKMITKQVNATTTLDWFRIISSANKFPASNFRLLIFLLSNRSKYEEKINTF